MIILHEHWEFSSILAFERTTWSLTGCSRPPGVYLCSSTHQASPICGRITSPWRQWNHCRGCVWSGSCLGTTLQFQLLRHAFKFSEMCSFPLSHLNPRILAVYSGFRFDFCPSAQPKWLDLGLKLSSFGFAHYLWWGQSPQIGFSVTCLSPCFSTSFLPFLMHLGPHKARSTLC